MSDCVHVAAIAIHVFPFQNTTCINGDNASYIQVSEFKEAIVDLFSSAVFFASAGINVASNTDFVALFQTASDVDDNEAFPIKTGDFGSTVANSFSIAGDFAYYGVDV